MLEPTAFQLDKGIFLKDRRVLLPWGASPTVLKRLKPSDYFSLINGHGIVWRNVRLAFGVGGELRISIRAGFGLYAVTLIPDLPPHPPSEPWKTQQKIIAMLKGSLGPPHRLDEDEFQPSCSWQAGGIAISVYVREHFDQCSCEISIENIDLLQQAFPNAAN